MSFHVNLGEGNDDYTAKVGLAGTSWPGSAALTGSSMSCSAGSQGAPTIRAK